VVAQRTRAVIIVGRKDKTKSSELAQLAGIFSGSGVQILGATLNSI
jgi:Mrp family chromosome partitioning ATPase